MALRSGFGLAVLLSSLLLPAYDSAGYEATTVSDGGTIKGKVVYTAAPPVPRKIVHTKDHEVCGSGVREVDQITIAPDKVVQDAVVYLKKVGRGKAWHSFSGAVETPVTVTAKNTVTLTPDLARR